MHRNLKDEGLICVSVTLDEPTDQEIAARVTAYLKKERADFENYVLDEPVDVWTKKLATHAVPAVFVFGRDGKLARAYKPIRSEDNPNAEVKYKTIEPFVRELLKKKP